MGQNLLAGSTAFGLNQQQKARKRVKWKDTCGGAKVFFTLTHFDYATIGSIQKYLRNPVYKQVTGNGGLKPLAVFLDSYVLPSLKEFYVP